MKFGHGNCSITGVIPRNKSKNLFTHWLELTCPSTKTKTLQTKMQGFSAPETGIYNKNPNFFVTLKLTWCHVSVSQNQLMIPNKADIYKYFFMWYKNSCLLMCVLRWTEGDKDSWGRGKNWIFTPTGKKQCIDVTSLTTIGNSSEQHTRLKTLLFQINKIAAETCLFWNQIVKKHSWVTLLQILNTIPRHDAHLISSWHS